MSFFLQKLKETFKSSTLFTKFHQNIRHNFLTARTPPRCFRSPRNLFTFTALEGPSYQFVWFSCKDQYAKWHTLRDGWICGESFRSRSNEKNVYQFQTPFQNVYSGTFKLDLHSCPLIHSLTMLESFGESSSTGYQFGR